MRELPSTSAGRVLAGTLAAAALTGACGADGSAPPASTGAAAVAPSLPSELIGTYTVKLRESDLPDSPPPELTDGGPRWTITIRRDGGVDGAPVFSIASDELGELESSTPVVSDDQLTLKGEECAATGTVEFLDNVYAYRLEDSLLTLRTIENGCGDRVAETILTSRPLTMQDG